MEVVSRMLAHQIYFKAITKWKAGEMPQQNFILKSKVGDKYSKTISVTTPINSFINSRVDLLMDLSKEAWKK